MSLRHQLARLRDPDADLMRWQLVDGEQQRAVIEIERIVASWTDAERADVFLVGGPQAT